MSHLSDLDQFIVPERNHKPQITLQIFTNKIEPLNIYIQDIFNLHIEGIENTRKKKTLDIVVLRVRPSMGKQILTRTFIMTLKIHPDSYKSSLISFKYYFFPLFFWSVSSFWYLNHDGQGSLSVSSIRTKLVCPVGLLHPSEQESHYILPNFGVFRGL